MTYNNKHFIISRKSLACQYGGSSGLCSSTGTEWSLTYLVFSRLIGQVGPELC